MFRHPLRHLLLWTVVGAVTHSYVRRHGGWGSLWSRMRGMPTLKGGRR